MQSPKTKFQFLFKPTLHGRLKVGVVISFIVLLLASYASYTSFKTSFKETENVKHTYAVKLKLEEFFSAIKDANRGISGLLLRNNDIFLGMYERAKVDADIKLEQLKQLTTDNEKQQIRQLLLKQLVKDRFACLDSIASGFISHDTLQREQQLERGKLLMDSTEKVVTTIRNQEDVLLEQRNSQSVQYIAQSETIIIIFMVVSIAIIAICFYLLLRSLRFIQEREKTYRSIFEYSKDMLLLCKPTLEVIEYNPTFKETFGIKEGIKINLEVLFKQEADATFVKEKLINGQDVLKQQITFAISAGQFCICQCNFVLIDATNKIYSVILKDITQRLQQQQEQEAMERFANIGKVSRMLAHEVRNPLTNINLAMENIVESNKDHSLAMYFDIVERNTARISKLITELLNSTKPNILEPSVVNVEGLIKETIELSKDRLSLHGIHIATVISPNMPALWADREKLIIALLNPIINAIEAMPKEGGQLLVEAFALGNQFIHINIVDNGNGMDEATKQHLFKPFYTNKSNGTGLGLAATQNIVLMHKGKIGVNSTLGKGTVITIQLPVG